MYKTSIIRFDRLAYSRTWHPVTLVYINKVDVHVLCDCMLFNENTLIKHSCILR